MELWLLFGILCYLSYSVSICIDKYMMNQRYDVVGTNVLKAFFNGTIIMVIGLIFFNVNFTSGFSLLLLVPGVFYALSAILYYRILTLKNVGEVQPFYVPLEIFFIFVGSVLLFNEFVTIANYIGLFLILSGVFLVVSQKGLKLPKIDKTFLPIIILIIIDVLYAFLSKRLLATTQPIHLAILMYFTATVILASYKLVSKKRSILKSISLGKRIPKIICGSFFGAMGTFLLYSALYSGNVSKVYPLAGLTSIFIVIVAPIFLKEKFYWHRFIGIVFTFCGIFLTSQ